MSFSYFLVEDAWFSQTKLLMSLKMEVKMRDPQNRKGMVDFCRNPNNASSSQANGDLGNLAIFP